jgi:hypothetical protein
MISSGRALADLARKGLIESSEAQSRQPQVDPLLARRGKKSI